MRTFVALNVILGLFALSQPVLATDIAQCAVDARGQASSPFGVVLRLKGEVTAQMTAASTRLLREGSSVCVGEVIHATASGEAVIKTNDEGYIAVRPNAVFFAKRFAAQGKKSDNMVLQLVSGSLRVITGWIGKLNPREHRINTPTSTIGIRGTDHEPYVLPDELATSTQYKAGTYDKVNRGKTTLGEGDNLLEIESGRVGFVRKPKFEAKGLMTILMPVLLDKVPDFYVPGQFDAELDKLSQAADAESAKKLEQKLKTSAPVISEPIDVAKQWLRQFDAAVVSRDATAILALFSPEVTVRATVHNKNGKKTTVEFDREELVDSTIAAAKGLEKYSQRRLTVDAEPAISNGLKLSDQIVVRSSVIEQGVQSGKSYRLEANEEYLLQLIDGKWLAIKAKTTQR
jgi:hypothetical protein